MGKDKDLSVFIKYGHVLYCFFRFCLFPFESIWEKRLNKTHGKVLQHLVTSYTSTH